MQCFTIRVQAALSRFWLVFISGHRIIRVITVQFITKGNHEIIYNAALTWLSEQSKDKVVGSIDERGESNLNHDFILHQNYPNPFGEAVPSGNPSTVIKFQIVNNKRQNSSHEVSLKVFDILGREIKILLQKQKSPGNYEVEFNSFGLPSGLYLYQLSSGKFSKTKKMIVIK